MLDHVWTHSLQLVAITLNALSSTANECVCGSFIECLSSAAVAGSAPYKRAFSENLVTADNNQNHTSNIKYDHQNINQSPNTATIMYCQIVNLIKE